MPVEQHPAPAPVIARVPLSVAAAVALVVVVSLLQLLDVFTDAELWRSLDSADSDDVVVASAALIVFFLFMLAQLFLAGMVLRRGRRSRAVLIVLVTLTIVFMAIDYLDGSTVLGLDWALATASVQCITLLCLSSESAGAWARRNEKKNDQHEPKIAG